jgi:hypothetical protein
MTGAIPYYCWRAWNVLLQSAIQFFRDSVVICGGGGASAGGGGAEGRVWACKQAGPVAQTRCSLGTDPGEHMEKEKDPSFSKEEWGWKTYGMGMLVSCLRGKCACCSTLHVAATVTL